MPAIAAWSSGVVPERRRIGHREAADELAAAFDELARDAACSSSSAASGRTRRQARPPRPASRR